MLSASIGSKLLCPEEMLQKGDGETPTLLAGVMRVDSQNSSFGVLSEARCPKKVTCKCLTRTAEDETVLKDLMQSLRKNHDEWDLIGLEDSNY